MGLMNKLKNILFEEEEVEIPVIEKKDKKEEVGAKEVYKSEEAGANFASFYDDLEPVAKEDEKQEEKNAPIHKEEVSEREIFKSEKTFNFPAFDEEEFESSIPKRSTNVLDYERKKNDTKTDYYRYEPKIETKKEEKPKFRPSPIISPVYGILDKNYTPDEITARENVIPPKNLDVDSVRKKAFGIKEETEKNDSSISSIIDEEAKVLEEKMEKARTIDELLKDSSDEVISLDEDVALDEETILDESLEDVSYDEKNEAFEKDGIDMLEEENLKEDEEEKANESDLFDLIDSMYENREDGE